jgi:hypothetical protein
MGNILADLFHHRRYLQHPPHVQKLLQLPRSPLHLPRSLPLEMIATPSSLVPLPGHLAMEDPPTTREIRSHCASGAKRAFVYDGRGME